MIVAIHQPNFLPWLGFFNKLLRSDVFVLFDDVQLPRGRSFANRTQIKTPQGLTWITVPVADKGGLALIKDARIAPDSSWKRKVLRSLDVNYAKAPYSRQYLPGLSQIIEAAKDELCSLNSALLAWCTEQLGGGTQFVYSSALCKDQPDITGSKKIQYLLKATSATVYISGEGAGSRRYVEEDWFREQSIQLQWQQFFHPQYPQLHGLFAEKLSIIDLILNCGPEARSILLSH
jgi:hypothetical protein